MTETMTIDDASIVEMRKQRELQCKAECEASAERFAVNVIPIVIVMGNRVETQLLYQAR